MATQQDSSDPTGVSGTPGSAVKAARDRKTQAALQLKMAGASWDEICRTLGYPTPRQAVIAVERALQTELKNDPKSQARMRALAGQRLERMLRSVWAKAIKEDSPEQMTALTKAREIIAQHTKLYGLDAPSELVVHTPTKDALEEWVNSALSHKTPDIDEFDIFSDEDIVDAEVIEPDQIES